MPRYRLFGQVYSSFLILIIAFGTFAVWFSSASFTKLHYQETERQLRNNAYILQELLPVHFVPNNQAEIDSLCKKLFIATKTRFTLFNAQGKVLGDSEVSPESMENHANRAEIREAIAHGMGTAIRFSSTAQEQMMYVAVRESRGNRPSVIIRTALPLTAVKQTLSALNGRIALTGFLILIVAAVGSFYISRRISRPILELKNGVQQFARGDLQTKISAAGTGEIHELAIAMNEMASQLNDRINTVTRQRNEQNAILSSMIEGVIAVDGEGRILSINQAARRMVAIEESLVVSGKWINEAIRNSDVCSFVLKVLGSSDPIEIDLVLPGDHEGDRFIQGHGASLRDNGLAVFGALVVFNDVTRLKRLENIRRDFVANVSHELKTPLTSIKGFVETILDGAIDNIDETRRFLTIARTQIDRLNAIVDDLLNLSRIEQQAEKQALLLERSSLLHIAKSAITVCGRLALEKKMRIDIEGDEKLSARVNASLLEQAIVNLIDNALKYSDTGGSVQVKVYHKGNDACISVTDHGIGIDAEHLPRLFERFYRVDKARSRKLGGTGLGLAIVKHIMRAHLGSIDVSSTLGTGSIFTLRIPQMVENVFKISD